MCDNYAFVSEGVESGGTLKHRNPTHIHTFPPSHTLLLIYIYYPHTTQQLHAPARTPCDHTVAHHPALLCALLSAHAHVPDRRHHDNQPPGRAIIDPDRFPVNWHPHRGMDILSYLKTGVGRHGDSMGNRENFETPGMQWISCGSGIEHAEGGGTPKGELRMLVLAWA